MKTLKVTFQRIFRIIAARCRMCNTVYMYDDSQNNGCPECGSTLREVVR